MYQGYKRLKSRKLIFDGLVIACNTRYIISKTKEFQRMNYVGTLESIKQGASKPLVLQLICVGLTMLLIWEITSGVGLLSKLNKEVQLHTSHIHNKTTDGGVSLTIPHPLFGEYVPSNLDAAGVRQSMLNIKVIGILFAANESESQVILQKENGQEHFFRVGDELPGGGVIKRITRDGVLVLREGELERLNLPIDELNFEASSPPLSFENKKDEL